MAYGRETLRKAGQALLDLDERYSDAIMDRYVNYRDDNPNQIVGAIGMHAGGTALRYQPSEGNKKFVDRAKATSAVAKYALPVAGAGLALKGAVDMANVIGQQTPTTLEPN